VTDKTGDGGGRVRKTGLGLGVGDRTCSATRTCGLLNTRAWT